MDKSQPTHRLGALGPLEWVIISIAIALLQAPPSSGSIRGVVLNAENAPLSGARVEIVGPGGVLVVRSDGEVFDWKALKPSQLMVLPLAARKLPPGIHTLVLTGTDATHAAPPLPTRGDQCSCARPVVRDGEEARQGEPLVAGVLAIAS